jgi:tRNA-uridine 2-sulfurtransferase
MKIAVAMSGGVDSSTAAAILKSQGHELVGFTMQLWNQRRGASLDENGDPLPSRCCSLDDVYDARRVAEGLGFPFYVLNLERDFEREVVKPFVESYLKGETPIPCTTCNSKLKFASLDQLAQSLDCEKVATGHYARIKQNGSRYKLLRGQDAAKDQSYFLWELNQSQLSRALFPLGEMTKEQVRQIAREHSLAISEKSDSQEICFVPDGNYSGFIDRYLESEQSAGEIVDESGNRLGTHSGIHRYTVGQRRGIGLSRSLPLYVVKIEPEANRVVVGDEKDLMSSEMILRDVNWISFDSPPKELRAAVRVRYRHKEAQATIYNESSERTRVLFDEPQRAITPGQAAVFYNNDEVLGGGWIMRENR